MIYTSKEATLDEMLYNGQISRLEYINRYSPECRQNFHLFCMKRGYVKDNHSAELFYDYTLSEEEKAHTELLD